MASKGPRSKLDHDARARRQKALEAPKEPPRPKTHWDHVLEEMVWLSKDFESERKWKLAQAKRVALRASKTVSDFATRGEKKVKEEEQRLKKVALNLSKDVRKFWIKIEKLVLYKYQLELEEKKKKALDKQLNFLLGQTERYSTMLAENLADPLCPKSSGIDSRLEQNLSTEQDNIALPAVVEDNAESDGDYCMRSCDELEDDVQKLEDEAHITEMEHREELAALQAEADMPLQELFKRYTLRKNSGKDGLETMEDTSLVFQPSQIKESMYQLNGSKHGVENASITDHPPEVNDCQLNGKGLSCQNFCQLNHLDCNGDSFSSQNRTSSRDHKDLEDKNEDLIFGLADEVDDGDFIDLDEEQDDETTLAEEEELTKKEASDPLDEIILLQQESEMPIEELLARYKKDVYADDGTVESDECASSGSENQVDIESKHDYIKFAAVSELDSSVQEVQLSEGKAVEGKDSENIIADAAAAARSAQPTGNTFSTTKVRTKFPFLLKFPLREYQHIGLDWLVTMYEQRLNGILADEMGLGKTIMTIALLAHLACERGIWGPHLIVVPTSVMLNWETEFLKWCPAFKILTYFGSAKERKHKRQGWLKPNYFHVCITTYRLVIQDSKVFKRKKWRYLILDEAHLIKNWKSQRWQTLLNFNSKRRILLTGTPLQNDLMELWSLMHFLMPHIFQSHQEFKDWFCNPISGMVEGQEKVNKEVLDRLHNVLRPFILRRLKRDVEKQLPKKHEHVIYCKLSKRQRNLYEDFIASSETQATLASSNFFGMISVIMQLRKVCNHPDLFEGRPIVSSFDMAGIDLHLSSLVCKVFSRGPFFGVDLSGLNFVFTQNEFKMTSWEPDEVAAIASPIPFHVIGLNAANGYSFSYFRCEPKRRVHGSNIFEEFQKTLMEERAKQMKERAASMAWWNTLQCKKRPVYGTNLRKLVTVLHPILDIHEQKINSSSYMKFSSRLADIILSPVERFQKMLNVVESFMFAIPASRAPPPICWFSEGRSPVFWEPAYKEVWAKVFSPLLSSVRPAIVRRQVYFPDRRLIQFDCGKLQELAILLRRLKTGGHRALIFTQMTKMLDILEAFINLYGYTYLRLDGSTQPEERQTLMQRFNTNSKYFLFILSTRSGGVGVNLVGADTVIFYDSDWNPAMDQQAQDRCHRIGQTREVHIYRLISESTIEENILKKANQKRALDDLVIQSGSYNMDFFKKLDPMELFSGHRKLQIEDLEKRSYINAENSNRGAEILLSNDDVEAAIQQAEDEIDYIALKKVEQEEAVENQEFTEDVVGRLEDYELGNQEDGKSEYKSAQEEGIGNSVASKENGAVVEEKALVIAGGDEDIDMLADVKQMAAAAAAAGQASSSFENQLRPIDRYAMRFLELWDPIVEKPATEHQVNVEEEEWELDQIEKFKDNLEAEIDEDQEPFLYERWDAEFATMAYRQHVEALAQRQLLEELECEEHYANEADEIGSSKNTAKAEHKPKKKKLKKAKFKSLKKGSLTSKVKVAQEEPPNDSISVDEDAEAMEVILLESPPLSPNKNKRKGISHIGKEISSRKISKKHKKASEVNDIEFSKSPSKELLEISETYNLYGGNDLDIKHASRPKTGKINISYVSGKRVMVVKPERLRKRGPVWLRDCFPPPDCWSSQEDAMLSAIVHEYGTHWCLASDMIYSVPHGGCYRGRFRHPVHCCERFRELFFKYVMSDNTNTEKATSGSGKALLKVTEDQVRVLLNVTSELPDNELLLQKHFVAVLSSVWRAKCRVERHRSTPLVLHISNSSGEKPPKLTEKMNLTTLRSCGKLVMTVFDEVFGENQDGSVPPSKQQEALLSVDQLDLTLEFPRDHVDYGTSFPSSISLSIHYQEGQETFQSDETVAPYLLSETLYGTAENRFRLASEACFEGEGSGWASSAFPSCDVNKFRSGWKSQTIGKNRFSDSVRPPKTKMPRISELQEDSVLVSKTLFGSKRESTKEVYDLSGFNLELGYSDWQTMNSYCEDHKIVESIQNYSDPNFISGLDDLDSFMDFKDIG